MAEVPASAGLQAAGWGREGPRLSSRCQFIAPGRVTQRVLRDAGRAQGAKQAQAERGKKREKSLATPEPVSLARERRVDPVLLAEVQAFNTGYETELCAALDAAEAAVPVD